MTFFPRKKQPWVVDFIVKSGERTEALCINIKEYTIAGATEKVSRMISREYPDSKVFLIGINICDELDEPADYGKIRPASDVWGDEWDEWDWN